VKTGGTDCATRSTRMINFTTIDGDLARTRGWTCQLAWDLICTVFLVGVPETFSSTPHVIILVRSDARVCFLGVLSPPLSACAVILQNHKFWCYWKSQLERFHRLSSMTQCVNILNSSTCAACKRTWWRKISSYWSEPVYSWGTEQNQFWFNTEIFPVNVLLEVGLRLYDLQNTKHFTDYEMRNKINLYLPDPVVDSVERHRPTWKKFDCVSRRAVIFFDGDGAQFFDGEFDGASNLRM
jgi:hypothetical protein